MSSKVVKLPPLAARGKPSFKVVTSGRTGKSSWRTPLGTLVVPVDGTVAVVELDQTGAALRVLHVFSPEEVLALIGDLATAMQLAHAVRERLSG